tara:strand:- start:159 stop:533 length:375 start_codon:yes stop_codon:yes gene_type:complete
MTRSIAGKYTLSASAPAKSRRKCHKRSDLEARAQAFRDGENIRKPSPAKRVLSQTLNAKGPTAMPAQSEAQQKAAGAALSAKRGETRVKDLQGASKEMYDSMTEAELEDMASTSHDNIPEKKES